MEGFSDNALFFPFRTVLASRPLTADTVVKAPLSALPPSD